MFGFLRKLRENLIFKVITATGGIMLVSTLILVYLSISFVNEHTLAERVYSADMMGQTIRRGLHDAMLRNSREEIHANIQKLADFRHVESIRVYNKEGEIKFSSNPEDGGVVVGADHMACKPCHLTAPPKKSLTLEERTSDFYSPDGKHFFSVLTPIANEPACSGGPCHYHSSEASVLGALDFVFAFDDADAQVLDYQKGLIILGFIFFLITSGGIFLGLRQIITRPLSLLTKSSEEIAGGNMMPTDIPALDRQDELGMLARAYQDMLKSIHAKQHELNEKMHEYELLFDNVPCIVTVQDRDYKLLEYNKESRERFGPFQGTYCYQAYKGVNEKCEICPVEKTFETGLSHCSEESRQNPDGSFSHWIVHTAPIVDQDGNVTKAMEMCLDITERKKLEERLKESEKKYHTIFNNVPNSIFVLDNKTLHILNCNTTASSVYGYEEDELVGKPFSLLFHPAEVDKVMSQMRAFSSLNQVKNVRKNGDEFFVDIMLAVSGHSDMEYLLVSTTDITERLEAEQLLIHAGKMATLGEMATGVAHELNQPLTVIKSASNFFIKKVNANEAIGQETLATLAKEVDSYVDRATKIISHMREFGRKVDLTVEEIDVNTAAQQAFTLLNKQFSARGIQMDWKLSDNLPPVTASYDQLEQVIINLLVNARDVLEEKTESGDSGIPTITVKTYLANGEVAIEVGDNGGGIPDDLIHKIFEPFFTTKKVGKGTGLGLSISYGLIKDFGGTIYADNGEKGAVFTIKLPVADS